MGFYGDVMLGEAFSTAKISTENTPTTWVN